MANWLQKLFGATSDTKQVDFSPSIANPVVAQVNEQTGTFLLAEADQLLSTEEFVLAEQLYRKVLLKHSNNVVALEGLGASLEGQKRWVESNIFFQQVVSIAPSRDRGRSWFMMGWNAFSLQEFEDALGYYNHAVAIDPSFEAAWKCKVGTLQMMEKYCDALLCIEQGLTYCPNDMSLLEQKEDILQELGRVDEASVVSKLRASVQVSSQGVNTIDILARASQLVESGQYDEAIPFYRQVLALTPRQVNALVGIGEAYGYCDHWQKSLEYLQQATTIAPGRSDVWMAAGVALAMMDRMHDAISYFDRAITLDPALNMVWHNKARAHEAIGQMNEVVKAIEQGLSYYPEDIELLTDKAQYLLENDELDDALVWFKRILQVSPSNDAVLSSVGAIYFQQ